MYSYHLIASVGVTAENPIQGDTSWQALSQKERFLEERKKKKKNLSIQTNIRTIMYEITFIYY